MWVLISKTFFVKNLEWEFKNLLVIFGFENLGFIIMYYIVNGNYGSRMGFIVKF